MGDVQVRVKGLKRYEREMQGEGQGWLIVPRLRLGGFRDRRLLLCKLLLLLPRHMCVLCVTERRVQQ